MEGNKVIEGNNVWLRIERQRTKWYRKDTEKLNDRERDQVIEKETQSDGERESEKGVERNEMIFFSLLLICVGLVSWNGTSHFERAGNQTWSKYGPHGQTVRFSEQTKNMKFITANFVTFSIWIVCTMMKLWYRKATADAFLFGYLSVLAGSSLPVDVLRELLLQHSNLCAYTERISQLIK